MDRRTVAKKSGKCRKKNVDNTQQAEKELVYFSNDTILETAKFLKYEKWSQMRFLCYRFNQLIHSNQSILQAFEVKSLSMSEITCSSNSIVSFDQGIKSADAMRKWFQDRGYSWAETTNMPLKEVFAGITKYWHSELQFTFEASYEEPNRRFANAVSARSKSLVVFSAELSPNYEFYGPILSHFFRLLQHPDAYFRQEPSLKWLKNNVRAQNITLFNFNDKIPDSEFHLVLEFLLDASIYAKDCITLDWYYDHSKFVTTFIEKYETLEVTKAIPSILIKRCPSEIHEYLESNFVPQDDLPLDDKRCDKCNVKTYELQNKLDGNRKMIAQVRHCDSDCLDCYDSSFQMRFE